LKKKEVTANWNHGLRELLIGLHGFELIATDKCIFCDSEPETFIHLFCTCNIIATFWENVSSWIESQ